MNSALANVLPVLRQLAYAAWLRTAAVLIRPSVDLYTVPAQSCLVCISFATGLQVNYIHSVSKTYLQRSHVRINPTDPPPLTCVSEVALCYSCNLAADNNRFRGGVLAS